MKEKAGQSGPLFSYQSGGWDEWRAPVFQHMLGGKPAETPRQVARIVLLLLVEERLAAELATLVPQNLLAQPGEGGEEL